MSQASIRNRRKDLEKELREAQAQVELVKSRMEALAAECEHPKKYGYFAMGEPGNYCPDCGYQD